jgi:DNA (cytosine-5)-methyltransferase 1
MLSPQLILGFHEEIFIDNFAGGGGASTGAERAMMRPVDHALNHSRKALAMHRMNHPQTIHHCEDIRSADPLKIAGNRRIGGIWFSPDCTHHSKARGGKPRSKHIRGLAWTVIHWVNVLSRRPAGGPRVIYLENVEEFQQWTNLHTNGKVSTWRPKWFFRCFTGALFRRGYTHVEWAPGDGYVYRRTWSGFEQRPDLRFSGRACDLNTPTIRRRLYLVARLDGEAITWPKPTNADPHSAEVMRGELKPHRMLAECLDFALPCPSIFLTKAEARAIRVRRPLAKASLARIAKGVDRYVLKNDQPFIVALTHHGSDRCESVFTPAKTVTAAHRGERALIQAVVAPFVTEHSNGSHQRNFGANEPMRTLCAEVKGGHFAAVAPYLVPRYGERRGQEPRAMAVNRPSPTVVPTNNQGNLVAVTLAHMAHGERDRRGKKRGRGARDVREPSPTLTGSNDGAVIAASVVKMRGDPATHAPGYEVSHPAHVISAQGTHHALLAAYVAQHNGGAKGHQSVGHPATEPASSITGRGSQHQVVSAYVAESPMWTPEIEARARRVAKFLRNHGVEFEGEFAMVGDLVLVDLGMRMLKPRELFRAMGFPEMYEIARGLDEMPDGRLVEIPLSITDQVRMCGNSVCPPMAEALVAANNPELRVQEAAA